MSDDLLSDCPVCGDLISENTKSCPNCGEPDPFQKYWISELKNKKFSDWITLCIGLVIVIFTLFNLYGHFLGEN